MAEGGAGDRNCPYCHSPLAEGDALYVCPACSAAHHEDCWEEGGGCAMFGCSGIAMEADPGRAGAGTEPNGESGQEPSSESRHRRLIYVAATLAVIVIVGLLVLLLVGGGDDEPSGEKPRVAQASGEESVSKNVDREKDPQVPTLSKEEKKQKQRQKMKEKLGMSWTLEPGGMWEAYVPSNGWQKPRSLGQQSEDESTPRFRTVVDGARGDFLIVDTTPTIDPTDDPGNFSIGDEELSPEKVKSSMAESQMVISDRGADECQDIVCVRVLMSDGNGGGIAFFAGSPNKMRAKLIAREFANWIEPNY